MLQKDQLSRITIEGYRSIQKCDIELGKINVLIGSNGAGKSNFISAFSLLQDLLSKNLQVSLAQSGLNAILYQGRKQTDSMAFEVFFGHNSYGFRLVATDDNTMIFQKEYFGYYGNWKNESVVARGNREAQWDTGVGNNMDGYVIPILKKQNWRVYHFHDTGRSAKVKQEHNLSNDRVLQYDAANLAAFLYRLKQNYRPCYEEIVQTIQLVAPYFSDFILEPQERNPELIVLKWRQKGCEDVFNASQLSDGALRFICLTVLLLQPHELQPATIVVDEPELGLHPYAITLFAEMVKQLSDEKQIILSTQSVELLNEFDVQDVIVVDRDDNGSQFRRLQEKELEAWLAEDYALGDLWKKNLLGGRLSP